MDFDNKINNKWMQRTIKLASLGMGLTSPNPLVGAVIVDKNGNLIAEGFHQKAGMPHAEAMALENLQCNPEGGSLYVNLEPCCHKGKTPPCVENIIKSGIKTVYVSIKDPDPRVCGKGINILQEAGLKVHLGLCETESLSLNKSFIHKNLTGKAYGTLKWAMSLDGRIGLKNGKSKWISNNISRTFVHSCRANFDAIIVGGNTLRNDDPLLTTRGEKTNEPVRVVVTKTLDLPKECKLWECKTAKTIVAYDASTANEEYLSRIPNCVEIKKLSSDDPRLLSRFLASKGCNSILWECGPKLATAALEKNCIQEIMTFIAPKILGGKESMNPILDLKFEKMDQIINLTNTEMSLMGNDIYLKNSF